MSTSLYNVKLFELSNAKAACKLKSPSTYCQLLLLGVYSKEKSPVSSIALDGMMKES